MTVKRGSKTRKRRGSRTHGWGLVHRGSGQKGGAGNAGSGKKADCKKPSFASRQFGRHGFKPKNPNHCLPVLTTDIQHIDEKVEAWVAEKIASKEADVYVLDLEKIGFTKLLSTGRTTKKLRITTLAASAGAIDKVQKAGGAVLVQ